MTRIRIAALEGARPRASELAARSPSVILSDPAEPADVLLIDHAFSLEKLSAELAALPRVEFTDANVPIELWRAGTAPRADAYASSPDELKAAALGVRRVIASLHHGPPRLIFVGQRWSNWRVVRPLFDEVSLEPSAEVGRAFNLDFPLLSAAIARRHARLSWDSAACVVTVEDLGSSTGTYVNGEQVLREPLLARAGDEISIGHYARLRVAYGPP